MKLITHHVAKPWGVDRLPEPFDSAQDVSRERTGEIWFSTDDNAAQHPLLAKYIFTSEKLSVQVHPNDAQASERGQPSGKQECWLIRAAEAGATLGIGLKKSLEPEELRAAALDGSIEELMDWVPVKRGDYFFVPAGTIHAIGAGVSLVELQQNADITYRLYDYGRPRELHLDDAVSVAEPGPYASSNRAQVEPGERRQLPSGSAFAIWHWNGAASEIENAPSGQALCMPLTGAVEVAGQRIDCGECAACDDHASVRSIGDSDYLLAIAS